MLIQHALRKWVFTGIIFSSNYALYGQSSSVTVAPTRGVLGKAYDLTITSSKCDLKNARLVAPQGSGIDVKTNQIDSTDGCTKTVAISIASDAPVGKVNLRLDPTTPGDTLAIVQFEVSSSTPGPIPPGLAPQVDVMWNVIDPDVAEDNFGHRVRSKFYCIQLEIGDNTGYDLQITAIGFKGTGGEVGNTDYSMVRGSLDWGHKTNAYSIAALSVQAVGPVLTAALPLVQNAQKRGHRAQLINILSPIATAMSFVYPYQDSFSAQYKHLDDSSFRSNFIVHNNQQSVPAFVFVAKTSLKSKCGEKDLPCIKDALGAVVVIGQEITYLNRISVIAPTAPGVAPLVKLTPPSLSFEGTSSAQQITLANTGNAPLVISSIQPTTANNGFTATHDCPIAPATLAASATCTIKVTFAPTAQDQTATITVTDNATGSPHTVQLRGNAKKN